MGLWLSPGTSPQPCVLGLWLSATAAACPRVHPSVPPSLCPPSLPLPPPPPAGESQDPWPFDAQIEAMRAADDASHAPVAPLFPGAPPQPPLHRAKRRLAVAVHLRLGDVAKKTNWEKHMSLSWSVSARVWRRRPR